MGLLNDIFGFSGDSKESEAIKRRKSLRNRICRIEEVERRELLSASPYVAPDPINVGLVYHEDYYEGLGADKGDAGGDSFIVAWNGGAQGTTLDKIVIDLNKDSAYPNSASVHFNIDGHIPNRDGTYYNFDADLDANAGNGITVKSVVVSQDGKTLTIEFDGFTSDKKFFFKIDVDEIGGEKTPTVDRLVTGPEMEGATVSGVFSKQDYENSSFTFKMLDFYSDDMATKLGLPKDAWYDIRNDHDNTAGALGTLDLQTPLKGSISGFVYEDFDNDGIKSAGEKGINGVGLELYFYNENTGRYETTGRRTQTANDTVRGDGYYLFDNIEGGKTYKVVETQPSGYADGKDTPGTIGGEQVGVSWEPDQLAEIHIGANERGVDYNFGELKRASISGHVYHDRNNNGVRETGEEGIANVRLKLQVLDASGNYVDLTDASTTTDTNGYYVFENLDPFLTYRVVEYQPEGWTDGKDSVGSLGGSNIENDKLSGITPKFDEHGVDYDFGEYKKGSIRGGVYEDDDNDGTRDPDERGISGVEIWLCVVDENGNKINIKKTVTDENGNYSFDDLDPGFTYCVTEVQPEEYCNGITTPGTVDGTTNGSVNVDLPEGYDQIHDINLNSGEHGVNYNFGEGKRGSISGYVYEDTKRNGTKDPGEKGIQGVVLTLWVWNGSAYVQTSKTATTDVDGYYEFTGLCPFNKYQIREAQPTKYDDGDETVGSLGGDKSVNDIISDIEMPAGGKGTGYNFGELVPLGSISGYVYVDANKNGSRDAGEAGIAGVTITLTKLNDPTFSLRITKTDANGYYIFTGLDPDATYIVSETQPADYDDGEETVGSLGGDKSVNDVISGIVMPWRGEGVNYNFGELVKPLPKGSLAGYVYVDADKNGKKDSGEAGIGDVTLTLWKLVDGTYVNTGRTATTNSNGYYIFSDLDPEEKYLIAETQPTAYDDGRESVGSLGGTLPATDNDTIRDIYVGPGQHGTDYNFGEFVKKVDPPLKNGSLSGYVYVDANKNGLRDSGEAGIAGVKLTLTKASDPNFKLYATTDADGYYIFRNLDPNETYEISEEQPTAYDDGQETVGSLGGDKSVNDVISAIVVGSDEHGENYNFGELVKVTPPDPEKGSLSGYVYVDADKDGVRDSGEAGIAGVTITLTKAGDPNFKRTTTTDSNGFYIFANLDPDETYHLEETQPTAYDDGAETVGSLGGNLPTKDNDTILNITVTEGAKGVNYNFGELEKVVDPPIPPDPEPPYIPPYIPPANFNPATRAMGATGMGGAAASPNWQPPLISDALQAGYGGGGIQSGYSWHLSVVNGGYPRSDVAANGIVAANQTAAQTMILEGSDADSSAGAKYVSVAWTPLPMNQSVWYVRDKSGKITKRFSFGPNGGKPLVGDFNGDGLAELAVFHEGNWYIDLNGNGAWDEGDLLAQLGTSADQPVVGDWDGDGKVDIGIFGPQWSGDAAIIVDEPGLPSDLNDTVTSRPKNMPPDVKINASATNVRAMKHSATGQTRLDVIDHVFQYGDEGDQAFTGDFSGDGVTKIGIYRKGNWYIDFNGNGRWDDGDIYIENSKQGIGTDGVAVVGDWSGDGIDKIGLFVNGVWHLDTTGNFQFDTTIEFGESGDMPVVGDFDGDGIAQLAVYRPSATDSLYTQRTFKDAPAKKVSESAPMYASNASEAKGFAKVANEYKDGGDGGQKTLPEKLQRHGRTVHTPHTDAPLQHRHRDR